MADFSVLEKKSTWHQKTWVTIGFWLIILILLSLKIGAYPLFDVDEPRYAEAAREMVVRHGDWITPHFNWVVRFDKPVLFYWLIAGMYKIVGVSAGAARWVSVLAATITAWLLYRTAKRDFDTPTGLLTAAIFVTMLEVFVLARWSITDMTLTACMTGTWLGLYGVIAKSPRYYYWAGIAGGLGLLTKGPVAVALPGITFCLFIAIYHRHAWKTVLNWHLLGGVALGLGIALPWYLAVIQANPETFIQQFFLLHNVERFASTVSGHRGGIAYYLPVLLGGLFPWTLFLPGLIACLWQQRKHWPPLVQYAHLWAWVVFIFFSVAHTKLLTYILPMFPAMALLMAWYGRPATHGQQARAWFTRAFWIVGGTMMLVYAYTAWAILPDIARIFQAEMVAYAQKAVHDGVPIATFNIKKPSLVFYTRRKVYYLSDAGSATPAPLHGVAYSMYVVVKVQEAKRFMARYHGTPVIKGRVYSLYQLDHAPVNQDENQ